MTEFRTSIKDLSWDWKINHPSKQLLLGSCFSENIGQRLVSAGIDCDINPFGIIYHPLVISRLLERLVDGKKYKEEDLASDVEFFYSFDHHGSFKNASSKKVLDTINQRFTHASSDITNLDVLYLSFGSAKAYWHKEKKIAVANCHKLPSSSFTSQLSSTKAMINSYIVLFDRLKSLNPDLKIVLTVSPVIYLKDGIIENSRSKSRLLLLCEQLEEKYDHVHYFPSYEILQSDLRDYRFYAKDMAHPNDLAIQYIWEYFKRNLFSKNSLSLEKQLSKLNKQLAHKVLHPGTNEHLSFIDACIQLVESLQENHPFLRLTKEREDLEKQKVKWFKTN